MLKKTSRYVTPLMILSCFWLGWCSPLTATAISSQNLAATQGQESTEVLPTPQEYTDLIAGQEMDPARVARWLNVEGWTAYLEEINGVWQRFTTKYLTPMRTWARQELAVLPLSDATVLYPFSGPDAINVLTLFPHAQHYLLIALEPVGSLPLFRPGENEPFYEALEQSLNNLLFLNYFITKEMASDMANPELDGVLPILLFFLGRENVIVHEVTYQLLQPDGTVMAQPVQAGKKLTGAGIPGVKILFQRDPAAPRQTLFYFQFNLHNSSWQKHPHFAGFLQQWGPLRTFLKAASYLLFNSDFAGIRQFIMDHSQLVLQTDEGIPWRYFAPEQWDCRLYGHYACPIRVFAHCWQPDLAKMYQDSRRVRPLPFVIGYQGRPQAANLMLAIRRSAVVTAEDHR